MAKPKNVDEYLVRLEGHFAQPILQRVREIIQREAAQVEEAIKWGAPSFEYQGLMMSMVAFKHQAAVWFHKGALLDDPKQLLEASSENTKAMRKYVLNADDELDEEALAALIRQAMLANEQGLQVEGLGEKKPVVRSEMLDQALRENPSAARHYEQMSESKKREYAEHIESAKQQATKQRRLKKSLDLLEKGQGLYDRYKN